MSYTDFASTLHCLGRRFFLEGAQHRSSISDLFVLAWVVPLEKKKPSLGAKKKLESASDESSLVMSMEPAQPTAFNFKCNIGEKEVTAAVSLQISKLCPPTSFEPLTISSPVRLMRARAGDKFENPNPAKVASSKKKGTSTLAHASVFAAVVVPAGWERAKHLFE